MIPELDDLEKTGIVTKSTALAIMKQLSESEFGGCTSTTSLLFRELKLQKNIDHFMKNKQKEIYHWLEKFQSLWRIRQTRLTLSTHTITKKRRKQSWKKSKKSQ